MSSKSTSKSRFQLRVGYLIREELYRRALPLPLEEIPRVVDYVIRQVLEDYVIRDAPPKKGN